MTHVFWICVGVLSALTIALTVYCAVCDPSPRSASGSRPKPEQHSDGRDPE